MTAPLAQQTVAVKDPAAVRRRRRRAPAGGASDDCFTCSKKNIKCDRRRPYCSQCLEVGSECSGYKTQLTWGVGVASRGKLRGLSLPVAKSAPVAREPKKSSIARSRSSSSVTTQSTEHEDILTASRSPIDIPMSAHAHGHAHAHVASAPTTPYTTLGYDYLSLSHPDNTPPMAQGSSWGSIPYSPSIAHSPGNTPKYSRFNLPLVTEDMASSVDSLNEVDYMSPLSQSFPREDIPYVHSPTFIYENYAGANNSPSPHSPPSSLYLDHSRTMAPTSCPSLINAPSETASSMHSHMDQFDSNLAPDLHRDGANFSVPNTSASSTWHSPSVQDDDAHSYRSEAVPSSWPTAAEPSLTHLSPDSISKMPFFMDYYETIMCPNIVFIDGPHNPFRQHILHLAGESQSLQHAICALASCNLRMKKKLGQRRRAHQSPYPTPDPKHVAEAMAETQTEDQALAEEYQHRNLAVSLLNLQLNDPQKSTHDSVLATILLLCHYRMVESGIAKFHTQFAGVDMILNLRAKNFVSSGQSAWMEAIFTYFDAISASINDRETRLRAGSANGPSDPPSLPFGAENLVGCDRELFRTISKLGRLNLLSQNRPVKQVASAAQDMPENSRRSSSPSYFVSMGHAVKSSARTTSFSSTQQNAGFNEARFSPAVSQFGQSSPVVCDDDRTTFWQEWKEARVNLQNWEFDSARIAASLPVNPTASQLQDLRSLSEAFRYAALLYTERIVSPSLPSGHQGFQDLVGQVIFHASNLEMGGSAEKFLLWPLFVAGSECVNELQQEFVRSKCHDIMFRSGYMNNLAALEILEKVWNGEARNESLMTDQRGPFNWAKYIGGPGVEVEWIMF